MMLLFADPSRICRSDRGQFRRRGFTLFELMIAAALLGALLVTATQILATVGRQRQRLQEQQVALLELGNQLEELSRIPWDELTTERLQTLKPSPMAQQTLGAAAVDATLTEITTPTLYKSVVVRLAWRAGTADLERQLQLTGTYFPAQAAE